MGTGRDLSRDDYRPGDWQPLAVSDPTPGSPEDIAALGAWCGAFADRLEETAAQLGRVCVDEFWKADAGLKFGHLVDSVAASCRQAAYRFRVAADVYGGTTGSGYALALDGFQSSAWKALLAAQQAQRDITNLLRTHAKLGSPEDVVTAYVAGRHPWAMAEEAHVPPPIPELGTELRHARINLDQVVQDRDTVASQAAAKLVSITDMDGMSDTGLALRPGEAVQTRLDAYADAQQLRWALAHADDPQVKAIVARIADDLERRSGEPGFVDDFINESGASLGGIASLLRGNPPPPRQSDHTLPLDSASQAILAVFGQALAVTARSDSLSPTALAQLEASQDAWSTAMLLQFGPKGSDYGDGQGKFLLADLARNLTDILIKNKGGYGLVFPAGQDAFAAILNRVSENPDAVRLALGDGSGEANQFAANLAAIGMAVPAQHHNLDLAAEQGAVAAFLASCGLPPDRTDPIAMQGTLNILTSFIDYQQRNPWAPIGDAVQKVLAGYTVNYMADLAQSTDGTSRGQTSTLPIFIDLGPGDVEGLLKIAYSNADSIGAYKATVADGVVGALAAYGRDPQAQITPSFEVLSSLYGAANKVQGDMFTDEAAKKDAASADRLLLVSIIAGGYGNAQLDSTSSKAGQPLTGILGSLLPSWFDTGHVQKAQDDFRLKYISEERTMKVMVLQAYVDSGKATKEALAALAPVLKDGKVQANLDFEKIFDANQNRLTIGDLQLSNSLTNMIALFGWHK